MYESGPLGLLSPVPNGWQVLIAHTHGHSLRQPSRFVTRNSAQGVKFVILIPDWQTLRCTVPLPVITGMLAAIRQDGIEPVERRVEG